MGERRRNRTSARPRSAFRTRPKADSETSHDHPTTTSPIYARLRSDLLISSGARNSLIGLPLCEAVRRPAFGAPAEANRWASRCLSAPACGVESRGGSSKFRQRRRIVRGPGYAESRSDFIVRMKSSSRRSVLPQSLQAQSLGAPLSSNESPTKSL